MEPACSADEDSGCDLCLSQQLPLTPVPIAGQRLEQGSSSGELEDTLACSSNTETFQCCIHGDIVYEDVCLHVIRSPEFQRLHHLQQLGMTSYNITTATHTRYVHSLGVGHLARVWVEHLRSTQPELGITDRDALCVTLAGLCHDLGHGPFSHVFEKEILTRKSIAKWRHESMSCLLVERILQRLAAQGLSRLDQTDIDRVKRMIYDPKWKERPQETKGFLYDIVSNHKTGVDVDKFDYLVRDAHFTDMKISFDLHKTIRRSKVIDGELCFESQHYCELWEMFATRHRMHREVYTVVNNKSAEFMAADALVAATQAVDFSPLVNNADTFIQLDDTILEQVEHSNVILGVRFDEADSALHKARAIIRRLRSNDWYQCVNAVKVPQGKVDAVKAEATAESLVKCISDCGTPGFEAQDVIFSMNSLDHAANEKHENPMNVVWFFDAGCSETRHQIEQCNVSATLPTIFQDHTLRLFSRSSDPCVVAAMEAAFERWLQTHLPKQQLLMPCKVSEPCMPTPARQTSREALVLLKMTEEEWRELLKSWGYGEEAIVYAERLWAGTIRNLGQIADAEKPDLAAVLAGGERIAPHHNVHASHMKVRATAAAETGSMAEAGGVVPRPHAGPALPSLLGFLRMKLPSLEVVAQTLSYGSSTTSAPMHTPADFWVERWPDVAQSVLARTLTLIMDHNSVSIPHAPDTLSTTTASEGNCNAAFLGHVLVPVNTLLSKVMNSKAVFIPNSSKMGHGVVPDFFLRNENINDLHIFVVGEVKVDDLVAAWHEGTHNVKSTIIPQIYNYSDLQNRRLCCLFDGRKLWLTRAASKNLMQVSEAFFWDTKPDDPTYREIMLWAALMAISSEGTLPLEDRPGASEVAEAGGGTTQSNQQMEAAAAAREPVQGPQTRSMLKSNTNKAKAPAAAASSTADTIDDGAIVVFNLEEFRESAPIGYGETGTVISAWLHGRHVAVKFGDCFNSKQVVRRLRNEVATYKALKQLQGTFIPRLEEYGYTGLGGSFFVATQLIKGHTHKAGSEVPMWQRSAAEQALAAIHKAGFLHGDVRSDNLIFEEGTGRALFLDLGLSSTCSNPNDFQAEMRELHALLVQSPTSVVS